MGRYRSRNWQCLASCGISLLESGSTELFECGVLISGGEISHDIESDESSFLVKIAKNRVCSDFTLRCILQEVSNLKL